MIPFSVAAASVIYNKRIFADNDLEVPTTWDELLAVCETLKGADVTPIYGTFPEIWTVTQGIFDYVVGGRFVLRDFFVQLNAIGADVGPDSEVSFQRTLAEPDFAMCWKMLLNSRDSRVLGFVSIGTEAIRRRLLPAWMIVSMQ